MIAIRVVSRAGTAFANPLMAEFGDVVGDIGRGADCTLVLPDPERQISRKQALITSRAGHHFICPIGSRAMVELDGALLTPDTEYPLAIGARIRIGPYLLTVEEVASADEPARRTATAPPSLREPVRRVAPALPVQTPAPHPVAPAPAPYGAKPPLPPTALSRPPVDFGPPPAPMGSPPAPGRQQATDDPLAIFGGSVRASKSSLFADLLDTSLPVPPRQAPVDVGRAPAPPPTVAIPGNDAAAPQPAGPAAVTKVPDPPGDRPSAPASAADLDAIADALYQGLGTRVPGIATLTAEHAGLVGALLRAALVGTLELLAARTIAKRELGASSTLLMARENNPLKFSPDVDAALTHLLGPPERGFIAPLDAVRDAFGDLRAHQVAVLAGMRAALDEVLARFDPQALEQRLAPGALWDKVVPGSRKAKLWETYAERYADILREVEGDFDTLFGRAFAQAYKAQLDELGRANARDRAAES